MGLDMYLHVKRSLSAGDTERVEKILATMDPAYRDGSYLPYGSERIGNSEERKSLYRSSAEIVDIAGLLDISSGTDFPSASADERDADGNIVVAVDGIYWRKANAIHSWFVTNCQDGVDECQESPPIPAEQLAHLAHTCQQAIDAYDAGDKERAGEILSPTTGFFFGSSEVDEWWADDVRRTILEIEVLVRKAIAIGGVTFTYQSSW